MSNYQFNTQGLKKLVRSTGFIIGGALSGIAIGALGLTSIILSPDEPEQLSDIRPEFSRDTNRWGPCIHPAKTLNESFDIAVSEDGEVVNASLIDEIVNTAADYRSGLGEEASGFNCEFPFLDQKLEIANIYGSKGCQETAMALNPLFVMAVKQKDDELIEEIAETVSVYKQGEGPKAPGDQCKFPSMEKRFSQYNK